MKTKILPTVFILILFGAMAFGQNKTPSSAVKTKPPKDSVYYTCPMHPEVRKDKPGVCPKCGMSLDKKTIKIKEAGNKKKEAVKTYTCPMHPDVRSNIPGKCPICGMELIEKKELVLEKGHE